ncbi:MAG: hypothetical protein PHS97_04155 [Oscillospiraceae bacterium]|nr:hypothetical protein [Oscillospiraceae bacterium]
MKRVKSACLLQTLHFQLKDDLAHALAAKGVKDEVEAYKQTMQRRGTKYKILEETVQPDDSILLRIQKQYNNQDCSEYIHLD